MKNYYSFHTCGFKCTVVYLGLSSFDYFIFTKEDDINPYLRGRVFTNHPSEIVLFLKDLCKELSERGCD